MKIALFSDIHGNDAALEAMLDDAARQGVDLIVYAGDAVNPFPSSSQVWDKIKTLKIPIVRGNHEDYVLAMHDPANQAGLRDKIEFHPVRYTLQSLSRATIAEIADLPLTLTLRGPGGDDVLVCHASPHNTRRSFSRPMDEAMVASLSQVSERIVVAGHIHEQWQKRWRDKWLVLCGGAGLPLNGNCAAQYLILAHHNGGWNIAHQSVNYDHAAALRQIRESDFLSEGGPIAWLFYDELRTAEKRMLPFLKFIDDSLGSRHKLVTLSDWQVAVQAYLDSIGRWQYLAPYVEIERSEPLPPGLFSAKKPCQRRDSYGSVKG